MARNIKGPGGSNEYSNPPNPVQRGAWDDPCGVEQPGSAPGANLNRNPPHVGRTTRSISGPGPTGSEQRYKGT